MKSDFLFELGTEELPPKILNLLSSSLTSGITQRLSKHGLNFGDVKSFATPRRLAVLIKQLDHQTADSDVVIWGPPLQVAFTEDGKPTKAAEAFAGVLTAANFAQVGLKRLPPTDRRAWLCGHDCSGGRVFYPVQTALRHLSPRGSPGSVSRVPDLAPGVSGLRVRGHGATSSRVHQGAV